MKIVTTLLIFLSTLSASEWKRVYLASYPRSGNHWTRYLIEEATHVATGSVYLDQVPPHMPKPLPWGGYAAKKGYEGNCRYPMRRDVVVIKTHYPAVLPPSPFDFQPYQWAIRIVRNPLDAFYAQHVRDKKPKPPKAIPLDALKQYIVDWSNFQKYWNSQPNVITIRYEDLFANPKNILREIFKKTGIRATRADIERAVAKFPPEQDPLKEVQYFSKSDLREIHSSLKDLLEQFQYEIN